jgi:hypothetical protein
MKKLYLYESDDGDHLWLKKLYGPAPKPPSLEDL